MPKYMVSDTEHGTTIITSRSMEEAYRETVKSYNLMPGEYAVFDIHSSECDLVECIEERSGTENWHWIDEVNYCNGIDYGSCMCNSEECLYECYEWG